MAERNNAEFPHGEKAVRKIRQRHSQDGLIDEPWLDRTW
jgi:hypothetical protein